jgi:hypothetical protein
VIYTIGYQRLDVARLDAVMSELECILVDCRAQPYSRRPEFQRSALAQHYAHRYAWKGDVLGGMPRGASTHKVTDEGLDWLRPFETSRASNVLLMCMEDQPTHCHRHGLIVGPHFPQALHVWNGGLYRPADVQACLERNADRDIEAVKRLDSWPRG